MRCLCVLLLFAGVPAVASSQTLVYEREWPYNQPYSIHEGADRTMWVNAHTGLHRLSPAGEALPDYPAEIDGGMVFRVAPRANDVIVGNGGYNFLRYSLEGTFLSTWFGMGHSLAEDVNGDIYLLDQADQVRRFDSNLTPIASWLTDVARTLAVRNGRVFTQEGTSLRPKLKMYSSTGQLISEFDTPYRLQVWGLAGDDAGNVIVPVRHQVFVMNQQGAILATVGNYQVGTGPGQFYSPTGVCLSRDGQSLYVADRGNYRVQKFAYDSGATPALSTSWGRLKSLYR